MIWVWCTVTGFSLALAIIGWWVAFIKAQYCNELIVRVKQLEKVVAEWSEIAERRSKLYRDEKAKLDNFHVEVIKVWEFLGDAMESLEPPTDNS